MNIMAALLAGLVFGAGLILSGMGDPLKVFAFLDVAGNWDPSLALVMAGAIGVAVGPFAWAARLPHSWLGAPMALPRRNAIDRRLLLGSVLFGAGWGLSGICPGPALLGLASGYLPAAIFAAGMFFGMKASEWLPEPLSDSQPESQKSSPAR